MNDARGPDPVVDVTEANAARVYDYMLGGTANFEVDRKAAEAAAPFYPGGMDAARAAARANRDFLGRAVRHLAGELGIRQFLDLGTGIPNEDNVHAVAHSVAPDARVVGVDYDPVVLAHAHEMLASPPEGAAAFVNGDFREPERILGLVSETLDFTQPVAVMLIAILHLIPDDADPHGLIGRLIDAVPSGSYLTITHTTNDLLDLRESARKLTEAMHEPMVPRTKDGVTRFFTHPGLELVDPGVVPVDQWHPELGRSDVPHEFVIHYAGVGRKP